MYSIKLRVQISMKSSLLVVAIMCFISSLAFADELNLMPYPQSLSVQQGTFALNKNFTFAISGDNSVELNLALDRFIKRIKLQTGLSIHPKRVASLADATFAINISSWVKPASSFLDIDEQYDLAINSQQITLNANSSIGALRGLETLLQLVGIQHKKINLPLVTVNDYPRFKWRGLLLDCSRHFFSVNTIKRQLDAMAAAKYNVFHWHLTDDQGWRIESKKFPKLQQLASFGEYYTQEDIRTVVSYAQHLGIQVLPEIDMPGHSSALAIAYPELMSAPGSYQQELRWGVHKPTLNPADEKTYEFIDQLIAELTELFPFEYIHIGGDEVDSTQWDSNADIKQFMVDHKLQNYHDLQAYFNFRLEKILTSHNRKMIGWDELLHPDLSKNIVIQSWRGPDAVADAIHNNFQAILSTGFYLDQPQPAAYHYRNNPVPSNQPLNYKIDADGKWQTWSFTMPRKRGSAVTGSFTLIAGKDGAQRGFIDFKNKSRRSIQELKTIHGVTEFNLDTWMGNVIFKVTFDKQKLNGIAIVSNVPYSISGDQIAGTGHINKTLPEEILQPTISLEQSKLVLGGEAALWAELVDENTIDLRIWPRAFVVGERLWSSKKLQDEDSLYQRMDAVSIWSRASVGVRDRRQGAEGLKKLVGKYDTQPLQILAESVETAQYYHRQHEKSVYKTYSKQDALNQFVDTLPAENETVRQLNKMISALIANHQNRDAREDVLALLSRWQNNYESVLELTKKNSNLSPLLSIATKVNEISNLGVFLVHRLDSGNPLSQVEIGHMQEVIRGAQQIDNEMIVAAAYSVEILLDASY